MQTNENLKERAPMKFRLCWFIPLVWMAIVGLAWVFRGGEWLALAAALLPGILMAKLAGTGAHSNDDLPWFAAAGLLPMLASGLLLDYARVRMKTLMLSMGAGMVAAYLVVAVGFFSEARRLGSLGAAAHKFDFNVPARAVAWQIFCITLGLYISIPVALLATGVSVIRKRTTGPIDAVEPKLPKNVQLL